MSEVIKGVKGFNKDLTCRGFQYELGGNYETDNAKACQTGFHFCENPLNVFNYYPSANSRYAEVEGSGKIDRHNEDSKVACTKLHIAAEIGLSGLISAGVKFILDRVNWDDNKQANTGYRSAATNTGDQSAATNTGDYSAATNTGYQSAATNTGYQSAATNTGYQSAATNTGDQSAATNTGDYSAATNTGYQSAATNTGYQSAASVEGKESIACGFGIQNKAKGALSCWLVLAEWEQDQNYNWHIKTVKSTPVDGEIIKADTWYKLENGEFVEVI